MSTEGIPDSAFTDIVTEFSNDGADTQGGAQASDTQDGAEAADTVAAASADDAHDTQSGAQGDDTQAGADADDPLRDKQGRFKGGFQARIDELTEARRTAERRAARAEAQLAAQNSSNKDAPQAEPDPATYDDYGKYIADRVKWEMAQTRTADATETAKTAGEEVAQAVAQQWGVKVEAAKTTLTDFDEVVGKCELPIAPHVGALLMEADKGPELAYHLAQNPALVDQLNGMSPGRAAMELGRIETGMGEKPPKAAPKAPAPITPVQPAAARDVNLENAEMADYIAQRRKQGARY